MLRVLNRFSIGVQIPRLDERSLPVRDPGVPIQLSGTGLSRIWHHSCRAGNLQLSWTASCRFLLSPGSAFWITYLFTNPDSGDLCPASSVLCPATPDSKLHAGPSSCPTSRHLQWSVHSSQWPTPTTGWLCWTQNSCGFKQCTCSGWIWWPSQKKKPTRAS